ncbi:hypothetical protein JCM10212_004832 [Sporobolomyces blumeae]
MSLKQELQLWSDALAAFDRNDYQAALQLFKSMEPSSKIFFNAGMIFATRGHHDRAVEAFERAIELDPYLSVAYFQAGVSHFLMGRYTDARKEFDEAWLYLRSNEIVDYDQLGLKFQLYSCEVRFNRGLCSIYMGELDEGLEDWTVAIKEKRTQEHDVIDEAFLDNGKGYTVFSVSVGTVFRPSEAKLANLAQRDFLGKATVVAATSASDLHVDFNPRRNNAPPAIESKKDASASSGSTEPVPSLSRSQTATSKLEASIDGVARPLRRRTTLQERQRIAKNQGIDPSAPLPRTGQDRRGPLPAAQDPRPPSPPDSLEELESIVFPTSSSATASQPLQSDASSPNLLDDYYRPDEPDSTAALALATKPVEPLRVPTTSFSDKRTRRHGLTIKVPPAPSSQTPRSKSRPRAASLDNPSPSGQPQATKPRLQVPHERSASLSSPSSSGSLATEDPSIRRAYYHQTTHRPHHAPLGSSSASRVEPNIARQGSTSSKDSSVSSGPKIVLSPVPETGPSGPRSNAADTPAPSPGLAYLAVESPENQLGADVEKAATQERKVRIRLRCRGDVRAMLVASSISLSSISERIKGKMGLSSVIALQFVDTDGCLVSIVDDEDWQSALSASNDFASLRDDAKLEIVVAEG